MRANPLMLVLLLLLVAVVFQMPAQQSDADRKWLAEMRAKAEKGEAKAQCDLGVAFGVGDHGVVKDLGEALIWYRKAAEQNYAEAQSSLGRCYAKGTGVPKDEIDAVRWYRKAAEQNYAQAQVGL